MKRIGLKTVIALIAAGLSLGVPAALGAPEAVSVKTLILYYSRTGNTKLACEAMAKELGADLIEVRDLKDRSGGWGFFTAALNALFNLQTGISPEHPDCAPYGRIIVASPVWSGRLSAATRTLLARNRFDGRKVLVFSTSNVLEKESRREAARKLVEAAGGMYAGHLQIAVTEKKDGEKIPKSPERIATEALALLPDIAKAFGGSR